MKKLFAFGLIAVFAVSVFVAPFKSDAQTNDATQLLQLIQGLQAQAVSLQAKVSNLNQNYAFATTTVYWLTVTKSGNGTGLVWSTPPGINCGNDCIEGYASGTMVWLYANADAGAVFAGWTGCDNAPTSTTCLVRMTYNRTVNARFDATNSPPEITYVSGPTRLAVNATGTWTFGANDPDGNLSVWNIAWGDNSSTTRPAYGSSSIEVFEHRYATTGLKTIWIEIRDTALAHDIATTTVKVIGPTKSNLGYQQGSLIESAKTQLAAMVAQLQAMLKSLR